MDRRILAMNSEQARRWLRFVSHLGILFAIALSSCSFEARPFQTDAQALGTCAKGGCAGASSNAAGHPAIEPMRAGAAASPPPATPQVPAIMQCLSAPTAIASSCDAVCCGGADGCCPNGCSPNDDPDCSKQCGDGTVQASETCEPDSRITPCPKSCDDGDRCTVDTLLGSRDHCNVRCINTPITEPTDADACCPPGATSSNDTDCPPGPTCGNGVVEVDEECDGASSNCGLNCRLRFQTSLLHRYSFEGTGGTVSDSIGGADGKLVRAALNGRDLALSGSRGRAVLPDGIISELTSATIEAWLTWRGGDPGQHLFEFSNTGGDPERNEGRSFWNVSPMNGNQQLHVEMNFTPDFDPPNTYYLLGDALKPNVQQHVAVAFDGVAHEARLYIDGRQVDSLRELMGTLAQIGDEHVWIGLSQFEEDPGMQGEIHEFRIYGSALNDEQIAKSHARGPDPDAQMP
jgi:hypothetical protein